MSVSGSPIRPMGLSAPAEATSSGLRSITARKEADIAAGQITLAVIPLGAHSLAAVRVAARSASFAVLYSTVPMWALTPLREHMLMMRP